MIGNQRVKSTALSIMIISFILVSLVVTSVIPATGIVKAEDLAETLEFYQLDFDLNGELTTNSDWGMVELTYTGVPETMYFNLSVIDPLGNYSWQIQNICLLSTEGTDVGQTESFRFDLGNRVGQDVTQLNYAYSLTQQPLSSGPSSAAAELTAEVNDCSIVRYEGLDEGKTLWPAAAVPLKAVAVDGTSHTNKNVPNQECGINECVPASVSNSLQWLNKVYGLGMTNIDIRTMKTATGWTPSGCGYYWWQLKDRFMQANGYPITTRMFEANELDQIAEEMDANQDIELVVLWPQGGGHCVTVVGLQKLADGTWAVTYKHDTQQGTAGGCKTETSIYDPTTGVFSGGSLSSGRLAYWVVECPRKIVEILDFYQLDFILDKWPTPNTDWGMVDLTYAGLPNESSDMYFNLVVTHPNGEPSWQVKNASLLGGTQDAAGNDARQTESFRFDLGNEVGEDVTQLKFGYLLTSYPVKNMGELPVPETTAGVADMRIVQNNGLIDETTTTIPAAAVALEAVSVLSSWHTNTNVPNQECGINECVPASVSNSLKWLNDLYNLNMTDIEISDMRTAVGCTASGSPWDWWELKDQYMQENGYPITTRKFEANELDQIAREMDANQDIELCVAWPSGGGHCVTVVGLRKLSDGTWSVTYKHDTHQGTSGGCKTETSIYDPTTGRFSGGGLSSGTLAYWVVECPKLVLEILDFYQLDFILDRWPTLNTDWGMVNLTYAGLPDAFSDTMYFNLVVADANGEPSWQVQNVCLQGNVEDDGNHGDGKTESFRFDLGNEVGEDVGRLQYGYLLTTYPISMEDLPDPVRAAEVGDMQIVRNTGLVDDELTTIPAPAIPLLAIAVDGTRHTNRGVPNQECGINECVPASVSNSLKWLNELYNLNMSNIDIDDLKAATGWTPSGSPWDWWQLKDRFMQANGYPITTRMFEANELDQIAEEMDDNQDIELCVAWPSGGGHCVTVVGLRKLRDGTWAVTYKHDTQQGVPGGCLTETSIYDPVTGTFSGGSLSSGRLAYWVVECPCYPDLVIDSLFVTPDWSDPSKYTITYNVLNTGVYAAGASTTSVDIDKGATIITIACPALLPGQSFNDTTPAQTLSGTADLILVTADSNNVVVESDETNNTKKFCWVYVVDEGNVLVGGTVRAYLELVLPDLVRWNPLNIGENLADRDMTVKSNGNWEVTVSGTNNGLMTCFNGSTYDPSVQLHDALRLNSENNVILSGSPQLLADGTPSEQPMDNSGDTRDVAFLQTLYYSDSVLPCGSYYQTEVTFTASATI